MRTLIYIATIATLTAASSMATAEPPPVELIDCTTVNRVVVDEIVRLELAGLDLEPDLIELTCNRTETVSVRVVVGSQALIRELDLKELPREDRERYIGLNLVEMAEILDLRAPEVQEEEVEPIAVSGVFKLPPATPVPDRPLDLEHRFGVYGLAHYQLGYDAPFGGLAGSYEMRTSRPFGARADLQLGFRTVDIAETEQVVDTTALSLGLQSQWWPLQSVAVGPGLRMGGVMAARDDTGAREVAFWGGLFAAAAAYFPLFDRTEGVFGLELGYSPFAYRLLAQGEEAVRMRGMFTAAYFGASF